MVILTSSLCRPQNKSIHFALSDFQEVLKYHLQNSRAHGSFESISVDHSEVPIIL